MLRRSAVIYRKINQKLSYFVNYVQIISANCYMELIQY